MTARDGTNRGRKPIAPELRHRNLIAFKVRDDLWERVQAARGDQKVQEFMRELLDRTIK